MGLLSLIHFVCKLVLRKFQLFLKLYNYTANSYCSLPQVIMASSLTQLCARTKSHCILQEI